MAKTVKISNSTNRYIDTRYRMPKGIPLSIVIQPCALLNEVNFHTEEHYQAWRQQNDTFFKRGILFENEKNVKKLEDEGKRQAKEVTEKVQRKTEVNVDNVAAAADHVNATLKIETEDLRERKSKRR